MLVDPENFAADFKGKCQSIRKERHIVVLEIDKFHVTKLVKIRNTAKNIIDDENTIKFKLFN